MVEWIGHGWRVGHIVALLLLRMVMRQNRWMGRGIKRKKGLLMGIERVGVGKMGSCLDAAELFTIFVI